MCSTNLCVFVKHIQPVAAIVLGICSDQIISNYLCRKTAGATIAGAPLSCDHMSLLTSAAVFSSSARCGLCNSLHMSVPCVLYFTTCADLDRLLLPLFATPHAATVEPVYTSIGVPKVDFQLVQPMILETIQEGRPQLLSLMSIKLDRTQKFISSRGASELHAVLP